MILRHTNTALEFLQLTREYVFERSTLEITLSTRNNFASVISVTQGILFSPRTQ